MLYPFANLLLAALALLGLWQLADAARTGQFAAEVRRLSTFFHRFFPNWD